MILFRNSWRMALLPVRAAVPGVQFRASPFKEVGGCTKSSTHNGCCKVTGHSSSKQKHMHATNPPRQHAITCKRLTAMPGIISIMSELRVLFDAKPYHCSSSLGRSCDLLANFSLTKCLAAQQLQMQRLRPMPMACQWVHSKLLASECLFPIQIQLLPAKLAQQAVIIC